MRQTASQIGDTPMAQATSNIRASVRANERPQEQDPIRKAIEAARNKPKKTQGNEARGTAENQRQGRANEARRNPTAVQTQKGQNVNNRV